jgi:arylsulfatase A-like enzyme
MMPTLSELTGTELTVETDGVSFLPTLFSKGEQKEHDYLYWEFHEMGGRQALLSGNWKLIRQPIVGETALELYDLSNDLHEDNNLAAENPEKVKELEALMNNARTESPLFNFGRKTEN